MECGPLKKCLRCGESKPATAEFFNRKLDGFASWCRPCRAAARRTEFAALPVDSRDAVNAARRAKRADNADKLRERDRQRYAANPDIKKQSAAKYRDAHPDRVKRTAQANYLRNRGVRISAATRRNKNNPERKREYAMRHYWRRSEECGFRLARAISAHINYSVKGNKAGQKWEQLLGFGLADLMLHLERQFVPGMGWKNYGSEWHVDHIVPLSSFQIESANDAAFKAAWSITNLRPLWALKNISKGSSREFLL